MNGEAAGGARLKRAVTVDSAKRSVGPSVIVTGASSGIGRALALQLGAARLSRRPDRPPPRRARGRGRRDRRGRRRGRRRRSPTSAIAPRCGRPSPRSKAGSGRPT